MALFTALIAPYFIDWTVYKKDFEEQASRIVGQEVRVGGDAEVRLLPLPSLAFTDLSVGRNRDGNPMLTVERFSANVELMPFLSGEVRVVAMQLDTPVFNIEVDENGAIAWTDRQQLLVDPDQVRLDNFTVRNGAFTVSGLAGGRSISGSAIDSDISAASLYGPWRISGAGTVNDMRSNFQISTGTYNDGDPLRLKLATSSPDFPYTITADGQIGVTENVLVWTGKFKIDPGGAGAAASTSGMSALPVKVDGDFQLTPSALDVSSYRSEIGSSDDPFVVSGKGTIGFQDKVEFRLEVDGRQIDVERIAQMQGADVETSQSLESRLDVLRRIVDQVPVPGIDGQISLEIPAIIAGDTYLREVSAVLSPFNSGWKVERLKTLLPGNTRLEANGRLGRGEDFGFTGDVLIASRQPSGFAAWAVGRVDPSIRKLNVAGLSGNVTLTANQVGVEQLELRLNADVLRGSLNRLAPAVGSQASNRKPAIIADLQGDRVSLEKLRAIAALAFGSTGDRLDAFALTHDLDVNLRADRFEGLGITASGLDTQFQYTDGSLSIVRLNMGDIFGASVSSRGTIADLLGRAEGNLALSISADNLSELAAFTTSHFPGWAALEAFAGDPTLSSQTRLELEIDSRAVGIDSDESDGQTATANREDARSRIVAMGRIGGTEVSIRTGLKGRLAHPEALWLDFSGEFSNEIPAILAAQAGLRDIGFNEIYNTLDGPFGVSVEAVGERKEGWSTLINASLPGTVFSAKGLIALSENETLNHDFAITSGSENVVPLLGSFGLLLPGLNVVSGDTAPLSLEAKFSTQVGSPTQIEIDRASLNGNGISGALAFTPSGENGRLRLDGSLAVDRLDAALFAAGLAGFEPTLLTVGGFASEEGANFSGTAINNLTGQVKMKANEVVFPNGLTGTDAGFVLSQSVGSSEVTGLEMKVLGGSMKGSGLLGTVDGAANLSGQISGTDLSITGLARAMGLPAVVEARGDVSTSLEATGKTPQVFVGSLSGNGVMSVKDARLQGLSLSGLGNVLKASDVEGFEVTAGTVSPLADEAFLNGSIVLGEGSAPFTLRNGTLRMRNVVLGERPENALVPVRGDFAFDLANGDIEASVNLAPDPDKEAVEGGVPEVTFAWRGDAGGLERTTDTSALEGFLSIRAFEAEQRKVETLQAAILEKQRLRRDLLNSGERGRWLQAQRLAELKRIEEERKAAEEAARLEAERLEAKRLEVERLEAERREAERKAAEEAERKAAAEAERKAADEARRKAIAEARRKRETVAPVEKQIKDDVTAAPLAPASGSETNADQRAKTNTPEPIVPRNLFENLEELLPPNPLTQF